MTFVLQVGITFAHVLLLLVIAIVPVLVSYGIWTSITYLLSKLQTAARLAIYFVILAMIIGGTSRGYDMALDLEKLETSQRAADVDRILEMAVIRNVDPAIPCVQILRQSREEGKGGGVGDDVNDFRRCVNSVWDFCYYHQRNRLILDPQPF